MSFRVSLPTCSIAARPVRGPAPSPARPSVRRAATLVAEKLHTAVESSPAAEVLSDTDFLAELRAHASRHGLSSPLLSVDEDICEQLPAAGAAERHQAGAASLQASGLRTQRRARPRLRRRAQRARAARGAAAAGAATESERHAVAGGHAFISREEEVELCAAITRGLELDSVRAQLEGSALGGQALREEGLQAWACAAGEDSVEALCGAVAAAEEAKGAVVAAHQGFLRKLARQFSNQGVAEDELLRVACDALVYAAGTFRDRGTRLLTYAWYFIMRDLAAAIRLQACRLPSSTRGSAVTVPFRLGIELRAMRKLEAQLTQQLGRPPTQAEVVAEAGVSEKKLRHLQLARRAATCMRWETLQGGRGAFDERGSGDEMISDADVMGPGGVASAPGRMEEALERGENTRDLEQLLSLAVELLPVEQQRTALRLRFGLADGRWRTLQQVADAMGRSQETARTSIAAGVRGVERVLAKLRLTGAIEEHMAAASSHALALEE